MPLPAGISTCTVTFGKAIGGALGTDGVITGTIAIDRTIAWADTGDALYAIAETLPDQQIGGWVTFAVPHVDQDGFVDDSGNTVKGFAYMLKAEVKFPGQSALKVIKPFQVLVGQTTIDLDLVPGGTITQPVEAPVARVTSVAGETNAVSAEQLAAALVPEPTFISPVAAAVAASPELSASMSRVNAADYGFLPAATAAANETAFTNALTAARSRKVPLFIPPGVYTKTNGLDLRPVAPSADGPTVIGSGRSFTVIQVATNTSELCKVGGYGTHLSDFTVMRTGFNPDANTADGLTFYKAAYSTFERLGFQNAGSLLAIPANALDPGSNTGTGNYMFSCTFKDLNLNRYWRSGIYLYGPGSTGSTYENLYIQNGSPGAALTSTGPAVELFGLDEATFKQLNIEDHAGTGCAILLNGAHAKFDGLHFERIPLSGYRSNYVRAYGNSQAIVNSMSVAFSDVAAAGAADVSSVFSVGAGGAITARAVQVKESTKTGSIPWTVVESDDTNAANSFDIDTVMVKAGSPAFTSPTASTYAKGIKRIGDTSYIPSAGGGAAVEFATRYKNTATAFAVPTYASTQVPLDGSDVPRIGTAVDVKDAQGAYVANAFRVTKPGVYQAHGQVQFAGGTVGDHQLEWRINSTSAAVSTTTQAGTFAMPVPAQPFVVTQAQINAGGLVTLWTYMVPASVTVTGQYSQTTWAALRYLGPAS